ncbi:type VI immunity family protein [Hyalangium rubrum]|uniref:DUF3396 domain-containing protein n=1 Tax=Hyalangium rubrum TaxID=3103134 RepID=A0ABU5HE63_9BACT|nr:type VI immunity family protein [Hyalangium sp. s54d21]MDY7231771.1 DUF3396 domain-containing protein [Hyalangium sp. s54d21]
MSHRYPRIRLYREFEGERYLQVRESISICFYMRRSHPEVVQSVLRSLELYRQAVGPQALAWYPDYDGEWQELDEAGWEFNLRDLLHPKGAKLSLDGSASSVTGYEVQYRGWNLNDLPFFPGDKEPVCAVAFFLPTEYLEERGPARVRELAMELAKELPFNSGHAGLSIHPPDGLTDRVHATVRELCLRYPGLDRPALTDLSMRIGTHLNGIHWLTFLGPPVLDSLGGAAGLRSRLHSPGTTVQELSAERAVVTLGEWPEAGDFEQGHTLPAYRELASVLKPWLYSAPRPLWHLFTPEDMRRWERRFLD